jgi:3-(3-hydroxy-phenyl)propionate hydroxylase
LPERTCVGSPIVDAPVDDTWLLETLGNEFQLMTIDAEAPESLDVDGVEVTRVALSAEGNPELLERYLGDAVSAVYLMRPDQHVAARWEHFDEAAVRQALNTATGRA